MTEQTRSPGSSALARKFSQAEADHAVGHMCLPDEPETNLGDEHSGQMDIQVHRKPGLPLHLGVGRGPWIKVLKHRGQGGARCTAGELCTGHPVCGSGLRDR